MAPLAMQLLREKSRSTLIYLLFAILIIVFVFTFNTSGSGGCGTPNPMRTELARVGDNPLDAGLLNMGLNLTPGSWRPGRLEAADYQGMMTRFFNLSPVNVLDVEGAQRLPLDSPAFIGKPELRYASFSRAMTPADEIKKIRVFNDLVENLLVAHEARKMGLEPDPEQINERVIADYWFDPDSGEFQADRFRSYLGSIGVTPEMYEAFVGNEILRENVIDLVAGLVTVSPAEATSLARDMHETLRFEYITLDPEKLKALVPVSPEETAAALADADAINTYYESNKAQYQTERTVSLRTLVLAAPAQAAIDAAQDEALKTALTDERTQAATKAAELHTQLAGLELPEGGDAYTATQELFSNLAKEHNADTAYKAEGGLFPETMSKDHITALLGANVAEQAIALGKGQFSTVIDSEQGFTVVFAEEVVPATHRTLDEVRNEIAAALAQELKAPAWGKEVAQQLLQSAQAAPTTSLTDIAQTWNEANAPATTEANEEAIVPGGPQQVEPPASEPAAEEPVVEELAAEEPVAEEPAAEEPAAEEPAAEEPVAEEEPVAAQPVAAEPVAVEPVAAEPTAAQPAEAEPVAAQPAAAEPTAAQPAAAEINPEGNDEAAPATEEVAPTETVPTGEDSPAAEAAEPVSPLLVPAGEDRVPGTLETEEAPETLRFEGMLVALQSPPVARLQQSSFPGALWNYPESQGADSAGGETDYKEQDDDWTLIPGFGKNEQLKRALFSLTTETPVAEILFEGEDGRIQIVRLLERNEPSAEELATLTGEVSRLLLAHRQRNAYRAWYGALLNRAIEDEFLTFTEEWQLQIDTEMQNYQRQANRAAAL